MKNSTSTKTTRGIKLTKVAKGVARYDKGIIGNEVELTPEGYIKGRCIVTRCGVFLYKNADGTVRKELRHPDDVSEPESLDSIKMIPVVDGHPPERLVTADNSKKLSVGYTGELVEDEYPYVIANLVVTDKNTVEKIKEKKKNQLSLGYTVDLIPSDGVYNGEPYDCRQTNIRYNHLAIVDEARAGPEAKIVLDGEDAEAIDINQEGAVMAKKRKIKFDDTHEYMVDEDAAGHIEKMMAEKMELEKRAEHMHRKIEEMHDMIDKATAERDSMRDKDHHDPKMVHEPLSGEKSEDDNEESEMPMEKMEKDEIGKNGKEMIDPYDSYGMQSHVRDYTKPSHMRNHAVEEPKNKHYPHDLPHVAKVDQADFTRQVRNRVKLEKLAERYLDKQSLVRIDSFSELDIKKKLIMSIQKNAQLEGKSEAYINARFDSILEDLPKEKVLASPHSINDGMDREKDQCSASMSRLGMIHRQKNAWNHKARV